MGSYRSFRQAFEEENKKQFDNLFNNIGSIASQFFIDDQVNVPEVTGELKKSRHWSARRASDTSIVLTVGYNTPYAKKVYFVTAKSGKLRWMEVTFDENKDKYSDLIKRLLK